MRKLCQENSGLDLVHSAVATFVIEDVFARRAVIADGLDYLSQFVVISGDSTCIAESSEVLCGVERVSTCITEGTGFSRSEERGVRSEICTAMGLGVVFDELQAIIAADIANARGIGTAAIEMDDHDGSGARGDGLFDQRIIDLQGFGRRLDQYRLQAALRDSEYRSDIGICRHDDFIALFHHAHLDIGSQDQSQRIEPVATANAVFSPNIGRISLFETTGIVAFEIPTATQHFVSSVLVGSIDRLQVEILDHRLYS